MALKYENKSIAGKTDRQPDFIIIGTQKGGTSSLFSYLKQHPQIKLPETKEIHFFSMHYHKGIDWYKSHFPVNGITGEASPYYLFHPLVAERIHEHCPETKFIVMLRDPVDRAYSHYMMQKIRGYESIETFEEAIEIESDRISCELEKILTHPRYNSPIYQRHSYLARGKYDEQLSRWFQYFPKKQFHFIKSEDFFIDSEKELYVVHDFLGLERKKPEDMAPQNVYDYPPINPETYQSLKKYFKDSVQKLSQLIGDQAGDWF